MQTICSKPYNIDEGSGKNPAPFVATPHTPSEAIWPLRLCGRIKNAVVGLVRPHSGICFLIIRAVRKAFWQKIDDLTVWDHAIRERAVKTAAAIWAYFVSLARPALFPAWAQRASSLLVGHSF